MGSRVIDTIQNIELFKASMALRSQPRVAHIIHRPELLIASRALSFNIL